jgi:FlaA1/EpsC-like NDP-sugar epimerase
MTVPAVTASSDSVVNDLLRCVIVGAGQAGRTVARDLRRTPDYGLDPVGFLDDNAKLTSRTIAGLPVLGTIQHLAGVAHTHEIDVVIVAIPSLSNGNIHALAAAAASAGLSVRYLPSFGAALERDARLSDLRHLRIDKLLGRQEMHIVRPGSRSVVEGKRVLVTGAGGSIGSELCRQIAHFDCERLSMLDHDESNLHGLELGLRAEALLDHDDLLIADIREEHRMLQIFKEVRPEVVFHAAAHKHLPLLELHPSEGVKSNVAGTGNLVRAAIEMGVETLVLISTDKAADPTSILGATKRVAERIVQSVSGGTGTTFASVRFGNVLGSRGSLLTVLAEQIARGEEITITHPDVSRFFMTVEEAVGLVLEAASLAQGGETFVLDMGKPVRIVDLARNYAAQLNIDAGDLPIRYTGLRPGEKLSEALFSTREERIGTGHPKIWATRDEACPGTTVERRRLPDRRKASQPFRETDYRFMPRRTVDRFNAGVAELCRAAAANRDDIVRQFLTHLVPEYSPPSVAMTPAMLAVPYPDGL